MNIEEKAEAYDEALERLKPLYEQAKKDDNPIWSTYEYIFPKLAESEDERLRKAALEGIEYLEHNLCWDAIGDIDILDVKEYLEKQKDQKDYRKLYENITKSEWFKKNYVGKSLGEYPYDFAMSQQEEQKEKEPEEKPINWNELTWKDIVELEGIINNVHYEFRNGIGQESFGKEVLEKFREYKGDEYLDEIEQNSAWSEDEKTVQLIKKVLYDSKNGVEHMIGDTDYYKCLDWIEKKEELGLRNTDALEKWLKDSVSRFISQLEYGSTIDIDALISDMRKQDFYNDLLKNYKL